MVTRSAGAWVTSQQHCWMVPTTVSRLSLQSRVAALVSGHACSHTIGSGQQLMSHESHESHAVQLHAVMHSLHWHADATAARAPPAAPEHLLWRTQQPRKASAACISAKGRASLTHARQATHLQATISQLHMGVQQVASHTPGLWPLPWYYYRPLGFSKA